MKLTDEEIISAGHSLPQNKPLNLVEFARAIESAVIAKLASCEVPGFTAYTADQLREYGAACAARVFSQEPVAWMCSNDELRNKGYQRFSATKGGDWDIPVFAAPQAAPQAAQPVAAHQISSKHGAIYGWGRGNDYVPLQAAQPVNQQLLVEACGHYEAALHDAFPNGAYGHAFEHWNDARNLLGERAAIAAAEGEGSMTQNDIIKLAREAGFVTAPPFHDQYWNCHKDNLERFATLVRAAALEEAAQRIESPNHNYAKVIRNLKETK